MKTVFPAAIVLLVLLMSPAASRAEDYVAPSIQNIVKILMRNGAINLKDDTVLDNVAQIEECKLYKNFYRDDFKWQRVRKAMRESIRQNIATYPVGIAYDAELQFERYDFKDKIYNFTDKTKVVNVNAFTLYDSDSERCGRGMENIFPFTYTLVLDPSLYIAGLPLPEGDAKTLMKRMDEYGNKEHLVYARFNVKVIFVETLVRVKNSEGKSTGHYFQRKENDPIRLDSRLDSADFYEDKARTKLIFSYKP